MLCFSCVCFPIRVEVKKRLITVSIIYIIYTYCRIQITSKPQVTYKTLEIQFKSVLLSSVKPSLSLENSLFRPLASLNSQGGTANIYNTYIYIIHVFRGGAESNFKSPGDLAPRLPPSLRACPFSKPYNLNSTA